MRTFCALFLSFCSLSVAPAAAQGLAQFIEDRDQVSIIEFAGNYDRELNDEPNAEPRQLIAQQFYSQT